MSTKQLQALTPGVAAEIVEPGSFAGAGDKVVDRRGEL